MGDVGERLLAAVGVSDVDAAAAALDAAAAALDEGADPDHEGGAYFWTALMGG